MKNQLLYFLLATSIAGCLTGIFGLITRYKNASIYLVVAVIAGLLAIYLR